MKSGTVKLALDVAMAVAPQIYRAIELWGEVEKLTAKKPPGSEEKPEKREQCPRELYHNGGTYFCLKEEGHRGGHLFELPDVDTRIGLKVGDRVQIHPKAYRRMQPGLIGDIYAVLEDDPEGIKAAYGVRYCGTWGLFARDELERITKDNG